MVLLSPYFGVAFGRAYIISSLPSLVLMNSLYRSVPWSSRPVVFFVRRPSPTHHSSTPPISASRLSISHIVTADGVSTSPMNYILLLSTWSNLSVSLPIHLVYIGSIGITLDPPLIFKWYLIAHYSQPKGSISIHYTYHTAYQVTTFLVSNFLIRRYYSSIQHQADS